MDSNKFTHVDDLGNPSMVDVSQKAVTRRVARARAVVDVGSEIIASIQNNELLTKKGPVFQTAIIAGVMAAKRTSDLIPLCHPLLLEDCQVNIKVEDNMIVIESSTTLSAKTGVEMEALTAVSVAALTVYDMCKAMSHAIIIKEIKLIEKRGGKSDYKGES